MSPRDDNNIYVVWHGTESKGSGIPERRRDPWSSGSRRNRRRGRSRSSSQEGSMDGIRVCPPGSSAESSREEPRRSNSGKKRERRRMARSRSSSSSDSSSSRDSSLSVSSRERDTGRPCGSHCHHQSRSNDYVRDALRESKARHTDDDDHRHRRSNSTPRVVVSGRHRHRHQRRRRRRNFSPPPPTPAPSVAFTSKIPADMRPYLDFAFPAPGGILRRRPEDFDVQTTVRRMFINFIFMDSEEREALKGEVLKRLDLEGVETGKGAGGRRK